MSEISKIEEAVRNLIKQIFGVDVTLSSKHTLKGLEIVLDCSKEAKGKILGKKGRTIKILRRIIKIMGKYQFNANILIFLKPNLEEQS
jgi:predicted RNA-binding protein YlqC (UPF0109 family)